MADRAILILVEAGDAHLFAWPAAASPPAALFWGPEYALRSLTTQPMTPRGDWPDEARVEGGALIDRDRRLMMHFDDGAFCYDVPLRRLYLELLAETWPGWDVRWADEGIADLADAAGFHRAGVLSDEAELDPGLASMAGPDSLDWCMSVGSVSFEGCGPRFYPLPTPRIEETLMAGPAILEAARRIGGSTSLSLAEQGADFPSGGFHLDVGARILDFWTGPPAPAVEARVAGRWPDDEVRWHRDRFESQLERSAGRLGFPMRSRSELIEQVRAILTHDLRDDRSEPAVERLAIFERAERAVTD